MTISKADLKRELLLALQDQLAQAEAAYAKTREAATHEEAKPENDKDTRALEQSYLARGQATRVEDLRAAVVDVEAMQIQDGPEDRPAALGVIIEVEDEDERRTTYFMASHGGGTKLARGTQVITPRSPLGAAILGKRAGDEIEAILAGKTKTLAIIAVR
ncbi:MAG: GreA/GreB family elongation factor [Polyangiaceae bacterium]